MKIYVSASAYRDGDGTQARPFKHINDAAKVARPGDEVLVAPGVYREYVDPQNAGTEDARITYRSTEPLGAVITGAEVIKSWQPYEGNVWVARVANTLFGDYNPYTTYVYGDWYFAGKSKHTGCVYLNDKAMYEAGLRDQIVYMNPILAQTQVLEMMENDWVEGWGCVCDYSATNDTNEMSKAFTEAWEAKYGNNPTPDVQGALYYCHTMLAVEAIRNADSIEPAAIRDAIASINGFESIIGTVYADEYTNLIYEIGIAKIQDGVPTMTGSVSLASDYGFGEDA